MGGDEAADEGQCGMARRRRNLRGDGTFTTGRKTIFMLMNKGVNSIDAVNVNREWRNRVMALVCRSLCVLLTVYMCMVWLIIHFLFSMCDYVHLKSRLGGSLLL